ncbi:MAG: Hsp20/alpha crystallin family protein [Desulfobacterales bacterium]|jgi:HSP20 family protein
MSELIVWRKQEIDRLRRDIDHLFKRFRREFGVPLFLVEGPESFSLDLSETEYTVTLRAELPGIKPEDIKVSVTDESLTLRGEIREDTVEKGENYERVARRSQTFSRTIALPCRIKTAEVKAAFKDGILEIVLPKCSPAEARGVSIEIK